MTMLIQLTKGLSAQVDDIDYEQLNSFSWQACTCNGRVYAKAGVWCSVTKKTKQVYMHRHIADPRNGLVVDHINRDSLDNRRVNLRCVSQRDNLRNTLGRGSSKYKYVGFQSGEHRSKPWFARFHDPTDGWDAFLGYFETEIEAHHAVLQFEENKQNGG